MIFLFIVPVLATVKVLCQGALSKRSVKCARDAVMMNARIFAIVAVFLAAIFFREIPDSRIIIYAAVYAASIVAFQSVYMMAFRSGPISLTSTISDFYVVFPLAVGVIFYNEVDKLTCFTAVGLVAMAVSFILIPGNKNERSANKKWLALAIFATVLSGAASVSMLVFARNEELAPYKTYYVMYSYVIAAVLAFIVGSFMPKGARQTDGEKRKPDYTAVILTVATAVALGLHNVSATYGIQLNDGMLYYPVTNVATIILTSFSDVIIFRQNLSKRSAIGIIFGAVAVVLTSL